MIRRPAVLPGGQRQYAGDYSSHRGMSRYGGNTQVYTDSSGSRGPNGGLEGRELKGGVSLRI
jgi:hypothetical protein